MKKLNWPYFFVLLYFVGMTAVVLHWIGVVG